MRPLGGYLCSSIYEGEKEWALKWVIKNEMILLKVVILIVVDNHAIHCSTKQGLAEVSILGDVLGSSKLLKSFI